MVTPESDALERIVGIARRAGAAILAHYDGKAVAERKADDSPITAADRAADELIAAELRAFAPEVPIISEEAPLPPPAERAAWERFWLVDPLDGTKEFLKRNGEFTVNIALVERGEPVLGVVYAPAKDLLYAAGRGLGSWKEAAGGRARVVSQPPAPGEPLVVVESRSHPSAELEAYLKTIPVAARVEAGSSLKFCWVAEGKAHVYPRFGPTMEWDVAAGDCVFRNSGEGAPRRSPLRYNKPDLRNDAFVIGME